MKVRVRGLHRKQIPRETEQKSFDKEAGLLFISLCQYRRNAAHCNTKKFCQNIETKCHGRSISANRFLVNFYKSTGYRSFK